MNAPRVLGPTVLAYLHEQPAALERALAPLPVETRDALAALRSGIDRIVVVGSGTSGYAARAVLDHAVRLLGIDVIVLIPTDLLHYPPAETLGPRTLVIGISQSGRSTGTLRSLAAARLAGARTLLVSGYPARTDDAEIVVDLRCGPEDVGAKTKGYTATIATLLRIIEVLAGQDPAAAALVARAEAELPGLAERTLASAAPAIDAYVAQLPERATLSIVGSGPHLATALEASLKILETARVPAEAWEIEEYLHGPHRRLSEETALVVLAVDGPVLDRALALVSFARMVGPHLLVVTDEAASDHVDGVLARGEGDDPTVLMLPGSLPATLSTMTAILPLQLLAVSLTARRGLVAEDPVFPDFHDRLASKEPE